MTCVAAGVLVAFRIGSRYYESLRTKYAGVLHEVPSFSKCFGAKTVGGVTRVVGSEI